MNVIYQLKGDTVVIKNEFAEPIILNLESVKIAIKNIKANRSDYVTVAAYELHLSECRGALAFLEANLKST